MVSAVRRQLVSLRVLGLVGALIVSACSSSGQPAASGTAPTQGAPASGGTVTIPIGAVARVESDAVHVALSKDEVGALPAVRVGRHG